MTTSDTMHGAAVDFDVAICGAGPVGQALALLLVKRGMDGKRIALIDAKSIDQAMQDARSIALSFGSKQLLASAGAWPVTATEIRQIHVSRRGHFGRTLIDCQEYDLPALGYVARYGQLVAPLHAALQHTSVAVKRPLQVAAINETKDRVTLNLADTTTITAGIVVQAEGGTFNDQAEKSRRHDYGQTAVISHITASVPLPQRAFERFTEQGPLALLPQEDGYALVWCVRPEYAEQLLALSDAAFKHALQCAFGDRLGQILSASKRFAYPLGLNAQPHATARTVTIGNAAQTLHPVAGQGLNLGLRDAAVLARLLAEGPLPPLTTEAAAGLLQQFLKQRASDRSSTIRLTDGMARVFAGSADGSLPQALLGAGLGALDLIKPAKKMLAEQMMFGWR
ncbi:FAD-dependent monooxygenase [Undibacterium sp.]|uniref:FAD-dependent monooxygenase n=1 Tax=Undibacterium sp. TaxID=1914977 RepID=UPI002C37F789|nr:FAD-dependent monooxygenase [Undibacterium sp.]HTD05749.1 FAD-dependent monooxygenase [Undibacterium sp.]